MLLKDKTNININTIYILLRLLNSKIYKYHIYILLGIDINIENEIARFLIENGADFTFKNKKGKTAFDAETVKILMEDEIKKEIKKEEKIQKEEIKEEEEIKKENTKMENKEEIKEEEEIIEDNKDLFVKDKNNKLLLEYSKDNYDLLSKLLQNNINDIDINYQDKYCMSALHYACVIGNMKLQNYY